MKKLKLFFSVALAVMLMSGSLFTQAQICDDNGEKRVVAWEDVNGKPHCWSYPWETQCFVPCSAEAPETIAP
ncbi:MAG: hypothetical protein AAFQ94_15855 [Bacteroidota bacterium]